MSTPQPLPVEDRAVERMRPHLRMTQVGVVAAGLAVLFCVLALVRYPPDAGTDIGYPIATAAVAVVLFGICLVQLVLWNRTLGRWRIGQSALRSAVRLSWWAHLLSYPVLLAGIYLSIEASALGGFSRLPGFCLGLAAILMLIAQVTSAVQYLRLDGPPGTVPTHVRNLLAWIQTQR